MYRFVSSIQTGATSIAGLWTSNYMGETPLSHFVASPTRLDHLPFRRVPDAAGAFLTGTDYSLTGDAARDGHTLVARVTGANVQLLRLDARHGTHSARRPPWQGVLDATGTTITWHRNHGIACGTWRRISTVAELEGLVAPGCGAAQRLARLLPADVPPATSIDGAAAPPPSATAAAPLAAPIDCRQPLLAGVLDLKGVAGADLGPASWLGLRVLDQRSGLQGVLSGLSQGMLTVNRMTTDGRTVSVGPVCTDDVLAALPGQSFTRPPVRSMGCPLAAMDWDD
jgi:hypothetical protein